MKELIERAVRAQERTLGVRMDYLRRLGEASLAAFAKFGLFVPLVRHRTALPPAPWHLARVAATLVADCGPCVQTVLNAARLDGVAPDALRAALDGREAELSPGDALAVRFGRAVAAADADAHAAGEAVAAHFGEAARVEMALAVATVLVFPTLKRGMGLARACALEPLAIPGEVAR